MPITPTYPGVYIEEIPSGVRTITGVATSITAFIGRALRGPVSEPIIINNFGEFESRFGGLWLDGPMSYAVRDFYQNGGSQAIIVRIFSDDSKKDAVKAVDAVVKAVTDKAAETPTPPATEIPVNDLVEAAQTEAAKYTEEPAKTAANQIVEKVRDAAAAAGASLQSVQDAMNAAVAALPDPPPPPTLESVVAATDQAADAAKSTIERILPTAKLQLPVIPIVTSAVDAVVNAVIKLADDTDATTRITVDAIDTAAKAAADSISGEPQKTVATQVYEEVKKAATEAVPDGQPGILPAALKTLADKVKSNFIASLSLILVAANPGKWGNKLEVAVNYEGISKEVAERYGLEEESDLFNLVVTDKSVDPATVETISNLSVKDSSRRVDRILKEESVLVRVQENAQQQPILPIFRPGETPTTPTEEPVKVNSADEGSDGDHLLPEDYNGSEKNQTGLYALDKADLFNLLCIPPDIRDGDTDLGVYSTALAYCVKQRAMLIVDPPLSWAANKEIAATRAKSKFSTFVGNIGANGPAGRNAAIYFPRVVQADILRENQLDTFVACGAIAGIMASTDVQRGVWKAPAGIDAGISGIRGLQVNLNDNENGLLNPLGINCLRNFPVYGRVVWGARTLRGADQLADEYKYLPVRRLLLFLQESLYRGTQWVVFEPNDEPLWAQIRLNLGTFMNDQFRQGAFQGQSPQEAYFVKCDSETTTQSDINRGIVNIIVGFAPLKPAEFVIIKFQQIAKLPS